MRKTVKKRKEQTPIATPTPVGNDVVFDEEVAAPAGLYVVRIKLDLWVHA